MLQLFLALRCEVQILILTTKCSSEDVAHRSFKEEKLNFRISAGQLYLFYNRKKRFLSLMLMLSLGVSQCQTSMSY